ncbi:hypothetical protein FNV43_RR06357 [Rhamnella rubrinervis]|uniref:Uncharacterized protein n=1 Tax=Rhamnella rubrinervis TaxID=2594499 RepID=A0A8K0MLE1_9ROSA|nr:hypothetical protein FNV43_RR06357 [Rhamnella rubrinervis]
MVSQGMLVKQFSLATIVLLLFLAAATARQRPVWTQRCGDVDVPFPFEMDNKTCLDDKFLITCNTSLNRTKAFLGKGNVEVTNISLDDGELSVMQFIAKDCYNQSGNQTVRNRPSIAFPKNTISSTKNKFFAIGCDTYALVRAVEGEEGYGCISFCGNKTTSFVSESCSGCGCCKTTIAKGRKNLSVVVGSFDNYSEILESNPCRYAFVADETKFKLKFPANTSFKELESIEELPMVINWAIGNESVRCDDAKKRDKYACKNNSECVDVDDGSGGYRCRCLDGFKGNPYYQDGCGDIDECNSTTSNPCGKNTICKNSPGKFTCNCLKGFSKVNETHCSKVISSRRTIVILCVSLCVKHSISGCYFTNMLGNEKKKAVCIKLLICFSLIYWGMKKRKAIKLKLKFFERNGGLMLQQQLSSTASLEATQIFSADELKRATNNYHENRIVGQGGYGIVYKGILPTNKVVAIKKSKFGAQKVNEQFINEVVLLLQINHRNVVKLLGCCLETEVPLLVYEFISNGTLSEHIHNKDDQGRSPLSWEMRLKIANETAGALAYLHSATSTPIIHRDVKTGNILLDEKFTAKISDFGASRLMPPDQNKLSTAVQGTFGYLDPEYMQSSQLTEKSDVYSFGVVLAELLTGKKVLSFERPEEERNLAMLFVSAMKDNRLLQIIDNDLVFEGNVETLKCVANLTERCLPVKSEERPTMKGVEMELEGLLRTMQMHQSDNVLDLCVEKLPQTLLILMLVVDQYPKVDDVLASSIFYGFLVFISNFGR